MMYQPNTEALYHGTINDATRELARIVYEVAKAHDAPYVHASAFHNDGAKNYGISYAKVGPGKDNFTPSTYYSPEPDKEDSTDGQA